MDETPPPSPTFASTLKTQLSAPRNLIIIAAALALGAAGAGLGWMVIIKPARAIANIRFQSHQCLMQLYDLQMTYRGAHGTFANDLDTLLASAPDGAQLREKLKTSVDINTLAVVGDAAHFRLEVNVLDPERTAVKIRGPLSER